jgi:hypothetical protein
VLTALDADPATLDEHERKFVANVREHGWFRTGVFAEEGLPGFSYTTGFWVSAQMPEIIIFSIKDAIAHDVLWDLFRDCQSGVKHPVSVRTDQLFANLPAYLFPVARKHYREHLGWSRWFYGGDEFPCLHLVWPDPKGVFPWEPGFDERFRSDQPDLTERGWLNSLAN